jgi:hypothetical protein
MSKTNFDLFLEEQLRDPVFAERFKQAGEAWDVALQLAALREQAEVRVTFEVRGKVSSGRMAEPSAEYRSKTPGEEKRV